VLLQGVKVPFIVGSSIPQVPLEEMLLAAGHAAPDCHVPGVTQPREGIVVEADEYGGAFLGLSPAIAVVSSIDLDHVDIYKCGPFLLIWV
jgi:UDP-N-acetylmuramate-alanine ligase